MHVLGSWLLSIFLSPSDVAQVLEALSWWFVAFYSAAVVVLVFPSSEVAQEVVLVLGGQPC